MVDEVIIPEKIIISPRGEHPEKVLGDLILESNGILTIEETDELCLYNRGHFYRGTVPIARIREQISVLSNKAWLFMGKRDSNDNMILTKYKVTTSKSNQIFEVIRSSSFCSLKEFDNDNNMICVENGYVIMEDGKRVIPNPLTEDGVYNTKDGHQILYEEWDWQFEELKKFDDNPYKTFVQFPVVYDVKATCPIIDKFVERVFGKERVDLIYEIIGYGLMPTVKYGKAFVLCGPPQSGKTTFLELLMVFVAGFDPFEHKKKISQLKLSELNKRFQMAQLRDKIWNVRDELNEDTVKRTEVFRVVVTNKFLTSEVKNIQDWVNWFNRCKQIFACNKLPKMPRGLGDEDWRRWMVLSCYTLFKDKNKMTQEDIDNSQVFEKDPDMLDKMTTPNELSGLLNRCLEGYTRLRKRGHFPIEYDDIERVKGLWLINQNPVKLFVQECCEVGEKFEVDYRVFHRILNEFRVSLKAKEIHPTTMTQGLKEVLGKDNVKEFKKKVNIKSHPGASDYKFIGIKLKKEYEVIDVNEVKITEFEV